MDLIFLRVLTPFFFEKWQLCSNVGVGATQLGVHLNLSIAPYRAFSQGSFSIQGSHEKLGLPEKNWAS